ncbi:hypothetical protein DTO063F5_4104 [Paecilomyces variotii]|nr:hypothetical protein DTO063F5_4104 [Paecilomyces variotii]
MSGYGKYSSQGHDNYFIGQQLNISGTYDNVEPHELGYAESAAYSFSQQPFSTYSTQLGSFAQPSCLSQNPPDSGASYAPRQYLSPISPQNQIFSQGLPHKYSDYASQTHYLHSPRYLPLRSPLPRDEVESQESFDESTMLSEPVIPPLQGFPDVREFDRLMASYVDDLSVKKQDKALIHAARARNIRSVLMDPKDTAVESAQFRFWVKKMFKLQAIDGQNPECRMICHEGKPVAIREKLFKILTKAHQECQHGGRDKTSAQVRRVYSWIPKELISRFVKICPTCQVRRRGSRLTPPSSRRESPQLEPASRSPTDISPPVSRRQSVVSRHANLDRLQTHVLSESRSQGDWDNGRQQIREQPGESHGMSSFLSDALHTMPNSIASPLNPPRSDPSLIPPQLRYNPVLVRNDGTPNQRSF